MIQYPISNTQYSGLIWFDNEILVYTYKGDLCLITVLAVLLKATAANNEECGVCETVIQYMESLLEENATVQEVEAIADKVCNFLPTEMQQQVST